MSTFKTKSSGRWAKMTEMAEKCNSFHCTFDETTLIVDTLFIEIKARIQKRSSEYLKLKTAQEQNQKNFSETNVLPEIEKNFSNWDTNQLVQYLEVLGIQDPNFKV